MEQSRRAIDRIWSWLGWNNDQSEDVRNQRRAARRHMDSSSEYSMVGVASDDPLPGQLIDDTDTVEKRCSIYKAIHPETLSDDVFILYAVIY